LHPGCGRARRRLADAADGYYSGYPGQGDKQNVDTSGGTFMRGTQIADARGEVWFHSVYPAWYMQRTVHVHFKIDGALGHGDTANVFDFGAGGRAGDRR